ncbi:MAG: flavin oxidoreductase/NADH oxidase, partial [Clostridia bacterium]|nr:flavin oxidoreductase/NADH oxidase [Clostridia bacterium]
MLEKGIRIGSRDIANRVVLQPMEGCDCLEDGSPSELTQAKYDSAAMSGAGVIWCEATAVCPEGRTNLRQMYLTDANVGSFAGLVGRVKEKALKECGVEPLVLLQLTHSGRQS